MAGSDSGIIIKPYASKDSVPHKSISHQKAIITDFQGITSICVRNSIADITFYDSNNAVNKIGLASSNKFPFIFTEKTRQIQNKERATLILHLKQGKDRPVQPFHNDWVILILIVAAFLYSLIRTTSMSIFRGVSRFFLFRGINDPVSRDLGGLFRWQSTILNFISFLITGLFAYCAASNYDFIPSGISGIAFWLIILGVIISAVTLRHIVCRVIGNISGEGEVFRDYLFGIYQSYRFSALFLFVNIILMTYTVILPVGVYFILGIIVLGIMYLISIIRLTIIFINRNISIFYLILYLCALEILPVLISVKYFTGLV